MKPLTVALLALIAIACADTKPAPLVTFAADVTCRAVPASQRTDLAVEIGRLRVLILVGQDDMVAGLFNDSQGPLTKLQPWFTDAWTAIHVAITLAKPTTADQEFAGEHDVVHSIVVGCANGLGLPPLSARL